MRLCVWLWHGPPSYRCRTLYESDPEQWKENLNRSTMAMGELEVGGGNLKSWRITVTDPRGGRGTDYRVDDHGVDAAGGLLLVPMAVPSSQRDWIQFLGRTARQDRKGQYCAVLCDQDYEPLLSKYGGKLATGSVDTIKVILDWGDREAASRIQASAALYNNGVRMNEAASSGARARATSGVGRDEAQGASRVFLWCGTLRMTRARRGRG